MKNAHVTDLPKKKEILRGRLILLDQDVASLLRFQLLLLVCLDGEGQVALAGLEPHLELMLLQIKQDEVLAENVRVCLTPHMQSLESALGELKLGVAVEPA